MRFSVEPSPAGGYHVRMEGSPAPLSHHDTLEEAQARLAAYRRGADQPARGELVDLPDGSEVRLRPVTPEDKPLFAAAWNAFGETSRYRRFMMPKHHLSVHDLEYFTEVDHVDHEALGAIDPVTGSGLGVARYIRDPARPDAAEAAVSVIDSWQGRGVGSVLLHRLAALARARGIHTFTASLFASNHSMLRLFERVGTVRTRAVEGAALEIDVELDTADEPTLHMALRSAATGHVGERRS
jgi:GNAT superfamily N-acetyltransferase